MISLKRASKKSSIQSSILDSVHYTSQILLNNNICRILTSEFTIKPHAETYQNQHTETAFATINYNAKTKIPIQIQKIPPHRQTIEFQLIMSKTKIPVIIKCTKEKSHQQLPNRVQHFIKPHINRTKLIKSILSEKSQIQQNGVRIGNGKV